MRLNKRYLVLTLVLFIIELIIALFLRDNIIRPYIGDILVAVLIYCAVRTVFHRDIKLLPIYVFIFAAFVEVLQLIDIVSILGLENNNIARIAVGSTFDFADILCYFTGALFSTLIQWIDKKSDKIILPLFIITALIAAVLFGALMYNGLWWPVYPELMGYDVKGIDVSRYQGEIEWKAISEQEIRFAFIKATEGSSYLDPNFHRNITASKENGIVNGAYHFFSSESPGITQATNFISAIEPYEIDMPPVLDFEIGPGREKEKVLEELQAFIEELTGYCGTEPIIYTTYENYNLYLSNDFGSSDFWFRDLLKKPQISGNLIFWQYCNKGRLNGVDKTQRYTDLNVFIGSEREFMEFSDVDCSCN